MKISSYNLFSWYFIYIQESEAKNWTKPNKKGKWKWWEKGKLQEKTNFDFKYILVVLYQIRQTTAEVKHCINTKTCLLYPHSHQRRQGWHPCHWQRNIPQWSEWTSGFWSSGCRTSDGNGLCSWGTLQGAISSFVRMPRMEKPSLELSVGSTHVQKAFCNLCHCSAILSAVTFPPPFTTLTCKYLHSLNKSQSKIVS